MAIYVVQARSQPLTVTVLDIIGTTYVMKLQDLLYVRNLDISQKLREILVLKKLRSYWCTKY